MPTVIPDFMPFEFAEKATLMAYFNEEQIDELRNFALAFFKVNPKWEVQVSLVDIGYTGLLLDIRQHSGITTHFLPFAEPIHQRDDLQLQYILLLQRSAKRLGKASIQIKSRQFVLLEKYQVTPNIMRLVLQSEQALSQLPAGYAFLLDISMPTCKNQRALRYYTLRKAWQEINEQGENENLAWIDVYCHGEKNGEISLGEKWVKSLKIGDIVTSEREFPEKIEHLSLKNGGQALLIADETSLSTVARLLETWQNALPPIIILFLQNSDEIPYLNEVVKGNFAPASPMILPVIANKSEITHEQIFATLNTFLQHTPTQITSVWGGLEAHCIKNLRSRLWDLLSLTREEIVLKVYWRKTNNIMN